jgi:hypothetical protein
MLPPGFLREHGLLLIAMPYDRKTRLDAIALTLARSRQRRSRG